MPPVFESLPTILKMIFGFGLVVFIHEFGHFLMARRNGVFVERFAIGFDFFGLRLATWRRNGTEYIIGVFPFGGYVKMLGQHDLPSDADVSSLRPDSFQAQSIGARAWIMSGGVIANFASAFVLCFLALLLGFHDSAPLVGDVGFHSLEAGIRPGDEVVSVAGRKVTNWQGLYVSYATQEAGADIDFVVLRDGAELTIPVTVHRRDNDDFNLPDFNRPAEPRIQSLVANSRAEEAGLELGDRLIAVDGEGIESWTHFADLVRRRAETDAIITVDRENDDDTLTRVELTARPKSRRPDFTPKVVLGVEPQGAARVDFVAHESSAYAAGIQAGDVVVGVEGRDVGSWYALWKHVTWRHPEAADVHLRVVRDNVPRDVVVAQSPAQAWAVGTRGLSTLGIAGSPPDQLTLGQPLPGGAAAEAGLQAGDVVVGMEADVGNMLEAGVATEESKDLWVVDNPSWEHLLVAQANLAAATYRLIVERTPPGSEKPNTVEVEVRPVEDPEEIFVGFIGIGPTVSKRLVQEDVGGALLPSLIAPWLMLEEQITGMRAMFIGRLSAKLVSGPVGILEATYRFAEQSTGDLLRFLALLSVNLAVVNFLPIPITDGGHFMFLMYEHVRGRRMDEEIYARFQWAGLILILMVFLYATFNDISRLLGLN